MHKKNHINIDEKPIILFLYKEFPAHHQIDLSMLTEQEYKGSVNCVILSKAPLMR